MHTQIIIDNNKNIRYIHSGFLGHMNDAQQVLHLPKFGPNEHLQFPDDGLILGDRIYANKYPIMTCFSTAQIRRNPAVQQR